MQDITVIILTYNESIHISRCIQNVMQLTHSVFVVDSFSSDDTVSKAKDEGACVLQNKWPGNQATQFNWALQNLNIQTEWVLRVDADEYLTDDLIDEIRIKLPSFGEDINGIFFNLKRSFLGKILNREKGIKILRLWRYGKGFYENRAIDERVVISEGRTIEFTHAFADNNLNDIGWWSQKHINYASREAALELVKRYNLTESQVSSTEEHRGYAKKIRKQKEVYFKMPLFLRAFLFFLYRYIFKLGFLDGKEGFLWHFLQGWWYRTLVDAKIFEINKACGKDMEKIKAFIKEKYNIVL